MRKITKDNLSAQEEVFPKRLPTGRQKHTSSPRKRLVVLSSVRPKVCLIFKKLMKAKTMKEARENGCQGKPAHIVLTVPSSTFRE